MSPITKRLNRTLEICCAAAVAAGFVCVFLIGVSDIGNPAKPIAALVVLIVFAVIPVVLLLYSREPDGDNGHELKTFVFDERTDEEFATLEEAAVFFSASLKSEEMFGLLNRRIEGLVPSCSVVFYASDGKDGLIRSPVSKGLRANGTEDNSVLADIAYKAYGSRKQVRSNELQKISDEDPSKYRMAAVPLFRGEEVFCVLAFCSPEKSELPDERLVEAIGIRVAPLIAGSMAFETSVANAFTDNLTQLPNERAMYLILESQVAEAQRFGKSRSLALVAVDIDTFDEYNLSFGHAEGDRVLTFAGRLIQEQLRKMDFLSRTSDDEFFLILPTTDGHSSEKVISRIVEAFKTTPYMRSDGSETNIKLNFGRAAFGKEGDTAEKLIRAAVENKQLDKPSHAGSVLRFPSNKGN